MTKKQELKLRTPVITYERARLTVLGASYIFLAEYVDPFPFKVSLWAKVLILLLTVEIARQTWVWAQETYMGAVVLNARIKDAWEKRRNQVDPNVRWRIRRGLTMAAGVWLFGWVVDGATTRCDSAIQCVVLFPRIITENLPEMIQIAFYMAIGMAQLFGMFYLMTKVGAFKIVMPGTIPVTFDDVWGQDKAVSRVKEQVELLEGSDVIEEAGGYMPKGMLLTGPPGTGKTMLAKAAANHSTKPLILIPPGGFASTFIGINFLKVWQLFKTIRKLALRHDGVIVFFDEIDSLGNRGTQVTDELHPAYCTPWADLADHTTEVLPEPAPGPVSRWMFRTLFPNYDPVITGIGTSGSNMGTLEAFLAAMDGMEQPRGLVNRVLKFLGLKPLPAPKYRYLMIGATNVPSKLDKALTRAGRFGTKVRVPFPSYEGRRQTIAGYLAKIAHAVTEEEVKRMARDMTRGTGAEIEDMVNEALLVAWRAKGKLVVTIDHVLKAMLWNKFGETDGPHEVQEDRRKVSVHEAGHAVIIMVLLQDYYRIWFGSVEKWGRMGGVIASSEVAERATPMREVPLARLAVSLASGEAEALMFGGDHSLGVGGDYWAATQLARGMVRRAGMGETLQVYGEAWHGDVFDQEVEALLLEAQTLAQETLRAHLDGLEMVAQLLEAKGTVWGSEIEEAFHGK